MLVQSMYHETGLYDTLVSLTEVSSVYQSALSIMGSRPKIFWYHEEEKISTTRNSDFSSLHYSKNSTFCWNEKIMMSFFGGYRLLSMLLVVDVTINDDEDDDDDYGLLLLLLLSLLIMIIY